MLFRIDPSNGLAIYDQLSRQIKFMVAHGVLREGDLIPSVRELAGRVAVNPNTVARSYRDLQTEGVVEPVRGEGLRVAEGAQSRCHEDRLSLLKQRLRSAVLECRHGGLAPAEIRRIFEELLREPEPVNGA